MNMLTILRRALCLVLFLWFVASPAAAADFQIYSAAKPDHTPAVAYNAQTDQYLVVWHQGTGVGLTAVMARRVNATGAAVAGAIEIVKYAFTDSRVSVAYNAAQNEFLVVYATGILPDSSIYGRRVSAAGATIGDPILLMTMAAQPKILYNSLAGNYLLLGAGNDLYSRKIGTDGQPLAPKENLTKASLHAYGGFVAAYAPIATAETPLGRYLVVKWLTWGIAPIMLDSDGKAINTMYGGPTELPWPEIHFYMNGSGTRYNMDVAYGEVSPPPVAQRRFLIVWSDDIKTAEKNSWKGAVWGGYVDADNLHYSKSEQVQDKTFPVLSRYFDHWVVASTVPTWKPAATFNAVAKKFQVVWRETPGTAPGNDATVNHIRGYTGVSYSTNPTNIVLSSTTGKENPHEPAIAASTKDPTSLVVWSDSRDSASTDRDIYGAYYSALESFTTTIGTGVQVDYSGNAKLKFDKVTATGMTTFNPSNTVPTAPNGMTALALSLGGSSVEITTTASFTGNVEVSLQYDGSGLSPEEEVQTTLRVFDTGTSSWSDITSSRDTSTNRVYGITTHLSIFAVMTPAVVGLVVTNTNDSGPGSLRQAILDANSHIGQDGISFAIPKTDPGYKTSTGVWSIKPTSALPDITDGGTYLDGPSQQLFAGDTNPFGPEVEIDGGTAGSRSNGFTIKSAWNTVNGLTIDGFGGNGILISEIPIGANLIAGCYIGVTPDARTSKGNQLAGIRISGSSLNFIGFLDTASANIIGGNGASGILISDTSGFNVVSVNCIGTDFSHKLKLGNAADGVRIVGGSRDNSISGFAYPSYVVIRNNGMAGVRVSGEGTVRNLIAAGSIAHNAEGGIILENGGNHGKSAPVITEVSATEVKGTAAPKSVLFIYNDPGNEGEEYCGLAFADALGKFSWSGTVKGPHVTAVAVDTTAGETTNNTSPFSTPYVVTGIGEENGEPLPAEFGLGQNYPNPFNPVTTIRFSIGGDRTASGGGGVRSRTASLVVYDLLGREVAVLVNDLRPAGEYTVTFDGSKLSSGSYFYRLQANGRVETKKLLLLR